MVDDDSSSTSSSSSSSSNDNFLIPKSKSNPNNDNDSPANNQDDDDDNIDDSLQINTKYAKEYATRKRREELTNYRQLKALGGIVDSDDDESSDDESEDEDAELLTKDMDVKIIKTLRALKSKDEGIYDRNVKFFDEDDASADDETSGGGGVKKAKKKMMYKDVVREHILEEIEAEEQGIALKDDGPRKQIDGSDLAYDKEQQEIRRAFLESTRDDAEEEGSEGENENWLKPKAKSKAEIDADQDEVKRLWEQEFASNDKETATRTLVDPKGEVQDPDKFLMDFMTNRKWLDNTDAALRKIQQADDESIESFQDKMDDFESKYNFRFEEAAATGNNIESGASHSIVHYARGSVGDNILRRKDETRRQKRLSRKERKAEERKAKEEQLRRLKNAKREELEERMQQVRNVLGYDGDGGVAAEESAFGAAEEEMILKLMEGEYDPEKFEQVMNATYGEDYYQQEDKKWRTDQDVKSDLAKVEDSDVVGSGDMYDDVNDEMAEDEAYPADGMDDGDEVYDEEEAQWDNEQYEESDMDKKLKAKMMDELYKLDYEDIIGDMPTRFKYRSVEPNNYGLSTKEILTANDSALKQFVSLKKMAPYRDEGEYQPGTKKRKRFRQMLKADREQMDQTEPTETDFAVAVATDADQEAGEKKKKRRRQKKGNKKNTSGDAKEDQPAKEIIGTETMQDKKHKTKKSKSDSLESKPDNTESIAKTPPATKLAKDVVMKDKKSKKDKYSKDSKDVKKKKKHKRKSGVEGVSAARLASYGI